MSHLVFQQMRERQSGRIVSISSVIGERGNAGQANYAATKSGLFGLTMSLASEGAKKGITANCVAPGYIETDMVAGVPQKAIDAIVGQVPVGRLGQPDEVARVVEFLADPDSGYITGQVYNVNGGLYMYAPAPVCRFRPEHVQPSRAASPARRRSRRARRRPPGTCRGSR